MINEKEWKEEQERLAKVLEKIRENITKLEPEISDLGHQVRDIRKRFWEEVTVNTSTDTDLEETYHSIKQQEALLSERERSYRHRMQQWKSLHRLSQSPYFGRIDFQEEGQSSSEQIYIGVSSFVDPESFEFLVYDWRAPIASMYYDYSPGKASYDTPGGKVEGTIHLKRQYQITDGKLQNMFDTSVTIGDDILQQVLGKTADSQMKSIVSTIQQEQNKIIRDDTSRMLIVQGVAGSGKTSAALQRVAYLLYKHRDQLTADQIVLFSPNPMFKSYVATVLPELGEENMQQATFQEYLEAELGKQFHIEDPFDQIEYVLTQPASRDYEARLQSIKYKASVSFLQALRHYADWLNREGMRFHSLRFQGRELITAKQMKKQFYSFDPSISLAQRVRMLQDWLLEELSAIEIKEVDAEWVQEELNYLDEEQYAKVYRMLHQEKGVFDFAERFEQNDRHRRRDEADFGFAEREEELLCRMIVREHFKPLRKRIKKLKFIDMVGLYAQLFADQETYQTMTKENNVPELWPDICKQTKEMLARKALFNEDATPYLFLKELVEGMRTNTQVRHVFVDEGQDYSLFQYEFLKKMFPRARMTVLGDFGQAIFTQSTELYGPNSPLLELYGEQVTKQFQLTRSYRSTWEITQFAKALLPAGAEIEPFERRGEKPVLCQLDDDEQRVARIVTDLKALQAQGYSFLAVITKTAKECKKAFELLSAQGILNLQHVTKHSHHIEKGTLVIPVYLAKGVEFDAVLIYDASSQTYCRENERKLFYTACTRAMHRLHLYSTGEWTPFLQNVDPLLYENIN